jgi:cytoskeletal protein RodZ
VFTPDGRTNVRRRLFVALLAVGLLLVAGFTAAAVASGGSPFALLEDQSSTADETTTDQGTLDRTTTEKATSTESTEDESSEDESTEDQKAQAQEKTTTHLTTSSQKVTICHHTGSQKHPFHPITVDEHAVPAHTGHGDTVGPCPATTPSTAPAAKHGRPKHSDDKARGAGRSQRSEQGRNNGNGQSHRPEKHAGGPSH